VSRAGIPPSNPRLHRGALRRRQGHCRPPLLCEPAAQRGRTPQTPSYFLKPGSSLSASGGTVERPAGCELLAFEGEIALVIGTRARRVEPADAWAHVSFVTAANDLGVYDLKYADKGSNLRSKGGDGFTPLGPAMLDAGRWAPTDCGAHLGQRDAGPGRHHGRTDLRLRHMIADLSQLMTLHPGDIVLTGTPAGSSVAVPGDLIEVEVDAPATGSSTGRLMTTVVEGTEPLRDFGNLPRTSEADILDATGPRKPPAPPASSFPVCGPRSTRRCGRNCGRWRRRRCPPSCAGAG
jgi:2-keto-4-pentenoate hydratase/2-oxohepta-3-ene-1,7-dioic acid hydratase in catechol pathway